MNTLTDNLKKTETLKEGLSSDSKAIFDHSMLVTANLSETAQKSRDAVKAMLSQSGEQLIRMVKTQPKLKSLIASITGQSKRSSSSSLVKGLEAWTTSLWSPEEAFAKTRKLK